MKLFTKIISILLVAGLASASAQMGGMKNADNFYVKGSLGLAKPQSDGSLAKSFSDYPGLNPELDSAAAFSFEGGMYYGQNFSFGFKWTMFNSDAKATDNLVDGTGEIATIKQKLNIAPAVDLIGAFNLEEEIDGDRFMFTFNYEHYFNDQFSMLINTGLGLMNVEQTISATTTPTGGAAVKGIDSDADETVFAYEIGVSLGYHYNEDVTIYGGINYLASSEFKFDHTTSSNRPFTLDGANLDLLVYEVGVRYTF